jgi:hypothetical protein
MVKATQCSECKAKQRATANYDGHTTTCCISCAKVHDIPWHTAMVEATRCSECKTKQRAKNNYDGHTTTCCKSCAKEHDHVWYQA